MKDFFITRCMFCLLSLVGLSCSSLPQFDISSTHQVVLSIAPDWNSNKGTVYLFDKTSDGWKQHGGSWSVSYGKNGLGWGDGLQEQQIGEYVKHEGDKRSPAGIFEFGMLYGFDASAPEGVRYPYQQLTEQTRCVDDVDSKAYNQIVEEAVPVNDWKSAERMRYAEPDYKYVLVVEHNKNREKKKGSCIFFHINNTPTTGCTSMDEDDILTLLRWLDRDKQTLLVQLPHAEYHRLRTKWKLPKLTGN